MASWDKGRRIHQQRETTHWMQYGEYTLGEPAESQAIHKSDQLKRIIQIMSNKLTGFKLLHWSMGLL